MMFARPKLDWISYSPYTLLREVEQEMISTFEQLEPRHHLSASIVIKAKVVTVTGTSDAEVINIANISSATIDITVGNSRTKVTTHRYFKTTAVKQINAIAGGGDDQIFAMGLAKTVRFSADGGAGNDQIQGTLNGVDTLTGGAGSDVILGGRGKEIVYARDNARDIIQVATGSKVYRDTKDSLSLL